jgi:hypothetical protein
VLIAVVGGGGIDKVTGRKLFEVLESLEVRRVDDAKA